MGNTWLNINCMIKLIELTQLKYHKRLYLCLNKQIETGSGCYHSGNHSNSRASDM